MVAERFCLLPQPLAADNPVLAGIVLTPAERRVLAFVRAGYSNKEIATRLGRSEPTIKHQVSSAMHKCGVSSRTRLMAALG
jgi:DNA-binding NarL/FixJ family response regulator